MNTKTAKRLRREANYKPSQKREYKRVNKKGTIELVDSDPRTLYRELKKEFRNNE